MRDGVEVKKRFNVFFFTTKDNEPSCRRCIERDAPAQKLYVRVMIYLKAIKKVKIQVEEAIKSEQQVI